jgi:hypothetical protein
MAENVEPLEADNEDVGEDGKRQRSAIAFPYTDYDNVAAIANSIHENVGHGECSPGQLAAWTNQSAKSSSFRTQLSAARLFGVIESGDGDGLHLTELGRRIVDPTKARSAKAEAFLRVPLFKALYEKYKDGMTPPSAALEREIAGLGVGDKQKMRARQVFESSAQQTGFREAAPNRLVAPAVVVRPPAPENEKNKQKNGGGDGGGDDLRLDPLLMALLRKVPQADAGWPADARLRWFRTFAMNVSQVYDDADPVELKIEVSKSNGG